MSDENALVPVKEKYVDFYGDEIPTVLVRGDAASGEQIYVPLRPICDYLGLSWPAQTRRIKRDPVLDELASTVAVTATDGRVREMICLPVEFLNGWLFGINASRVNEDLREKVIRYQRECYRVLAGAFLDRTDDLSGSTATLWQVREMGLAIARMAEEQIEFDHRLTSTESRLDQAAYVVGDLTKRLGTLEQRLAPGQPVTEDQASQISQAVKAVAIKLAEKSGRNEFGGVYGELYRKFGITSYKMLPVAQFEAALNYLNEWYGSLTGEEPF